MADDELSETKTVTRYHRRLDRTPEKNFDNRQEDVKILCSENRKAVEKLSFKMTRLQDEIDDRDKTIETEQKLRKEAEDKLQAYLVDPYRNPDVNDELRERLPRASKTDPLRDSAQEVEEVMEKEKVQRTATARLQDGEETEGDRKQSHRNSEADASGPILTSSLSTTAANRLSTTSTLSNSLYGAPHLSTATAYFPQAYTPAYMSPFHSPTYLQQPPSSFLSPPRTFGMATGTDTNPKAKSTLAKDEMSPLSLATEETVSPLKVSDLNSSTHERKEEKDQVPNSVQNNSTAPSSAFPPSFRPGYSGFHLYPPPGGAYFQDPLQLRLSSGYMSAPLGPDEQSRQVAFLLAELDSEKAKNKKLVNKLADLEIEMETCKLNLKTKDLDQRISSEAAEAASLVQEVHAAQKKREESVMGRIKIANQERDEALYHLREVERRLEDQGYGTPDRSPDRSDEDDIEEEADEIDMTGNMVRECATFTRKLEQMKQRQQEIMAEEMQAVLDQRDAALAKAKRLEEDLLRQERRESHITEKYIREKLLTLQHEHDTALAQNRQLKDELQTARIYYSLHKSLSDRSNTNITQTYSTTGEDRTQKESNTTVAQLRALEHKNMQLEADLQKTEHENQLSQEEKLRLERHIEVLQKKLRKRNTDNPQEHQ